MNYGSSTSNGKPWRWVRLHLMLTMRDIYINCNLNPLTKFTGSSISTKLKDIFPWNISQMITKSVPISISRRIVISYTMKWGFPFEFDGKSMETETATWSEFPNGGKSIVEQILASEDSESVRVTVRDLNREINHLSEVIWDTKTVAKITSSTSSTRIG